MTLTEIKGRDCLMRERERERERESFPLHDIMTRDKYYL